MKTWHVYMTRCACGALYTGIAIDIKSRISKHNTGKGSKAVRALGLPVRLVYHKKVGSYSEALKEENRIKRLSKKQKEELVSRN